MHLKLRERGILMKDFVARRVTRSHVLRLSGRPDDVFRLFDPIGEKKWSEDWKPTMIFPTSGVCQGAVFLTRDHHGTEAIWIIAEFDEIKHSIVYTSVTSNLKVSHISINCEADRADHTKASVSYTITALSERGNQYVRSISKEHYNKQMKKWEEAINHYLQYGHPLRHH